MILGVMSKVGVNWYDMNVLTHNGINWYDYECIEPYRDQLE